MEREGESGELEIDGEKMRILISSLLEGRNPRLPEPDDLPLSNSLENLLSVQLRLYELSYVEFINLLHDNVLHG